MCDRLAEDGGFTVVCPDVFRGKPWALDRFPPKPEDNFMDWLKGDKVILTRVLWHEYQVWSHTWSLVVEYTLGFSRPLSCL